MPGGDVSAFKNNLVVKNICDEMEEGEEEVDEATPDPPPRLCDDCKDDDGREGRCSSNVSSSAMLLCFNE